MRLSLGTLLLVAAVVLFCLAAVGVQAGFKLEDAGLACFAGSVLLP